MRKILLGQNQEVYRDLIHVYPDIYVNIKSFDRSAFSDLTNFFRDQGGIILVGSDFFSFNGEPSLKEYDLITFYVLKEKPNSLIDSLNTSSFTHYDTRGGRRKFFVENFLCGEKDTGDSLVKLIPSKGLLAVARILPIKTLTEKLRFFGTKCTPYRVGISSEEVFFGNERTSPVYSYVI